MPLFYSLFIVLEEMKKLKHEERTYVVQKTVYCIKKLYILQTATLYLCDEKKLQQPNLQSL